MTSPSVKYKYSEDVFFLRFAGYRIDMTSVAVGIATFARPNEKRQT